MFIDYAINIFIGYLQFMFTFSLFNMKEKKWKILLSSTLLLSVYTYLYTNLQEYVNLFVMTVLYVIITVLLMLIIHKNNLLISVFMSLTLVMMSAIIEYIMLYVFLLLDYQVLFHEIYGDRIYYFAVKAVVILLWLFINTLVYYFVKKKGMVFFNSKFISWKTNLVILFIYAMASIHQVVIEHEIQWDAHVYELFNLFLVISAIIYVTFSFYFSYVASTKQEELLSSKLYIKSLNEMLEHMRDFKHNLGNLLLSIQGMAERKDYEELIEFTKGLRQDYDSVVNRDLINYYFKDTSVLYGIMISKMQLAELHNVQFDFEPSAAVEDYHIRSVDLARMIGILLDNAFEATIESEIKKVQMVIRREHGQLVFRISNACKSEIDPKKIYEEGYSSKENHSGLGLFEIQKIISEYKRRGIFISLETVCETKKVTQILSL